jgi:hypothetical protein
MGNLAQSRQPGVLGNQCVVVKQQNIRPGRSGGHALVIPPGEAEIRRIFNQYNIWLLP